MTIQVERARVGTQVDVEEIETTRSEKLLAFVLAAFLLVGGLWIYFQLDDIPAKPDYAGQPFAQPGSLSLDQDAIQRYRGAQSEVRRSRQAEQSARADLELRREAYRTAIEAEQPSLQLKASYEQAQSVFADARARRRQAQAAAAAARPAAIAAERRISATGQQRASELEDQRVEHDRITFFLRLAYVLATAGFGYWLLGRIRRRRPRYMALALAFVGFAAVQALVMASDYTYDYVEFKDVGLLTISVVGIAMTLGAFVALQRYLARRIPQRRVRKHECPFCGYPVAANERCEGCGRAVFGQCSTCQNKRRVGTAHCGVCGAV